MPSPSKLIRDGKAKLAKIRITVEELPELETEVALAGSVKQQEVGGTICLILVAGIVLGG
jgi:hypothetical protein